MRPPKGESLSRQTLCSVFKEESEVKDSKGYFYSIIKAGCLILGLYVFLIYSKKRKYVVLFQQKPNSFPDIHDEKVCDKKVRDNVNDNDIRVYITKKGTKYHFSGCIVLGKSKTEISLFEAKAKGYEACSICKPPK
jgi:hypothetical protein